MNTPEVAIAPDSTLVDDPSDVAEVSAARSRGSAAVDLELKERRARGVELTARLERVTNELKELRASRSRAVADGKPGPSAKELATLAEEQSGLEDALALLGDDCMHLEEEHAVAELHEAREAELSAMQLARDALDAVEAAVRSAAGQILPYADSFDESLRVARGSENEANRLARRADPSLSDLQPERLARVVRRRTALVELVQHLRTWARNNS